MRDARKQRKYYKYLKSQKTISKISDNKADEENRQWDIQYV